MKKRPPKKEDAEKEQISRAEDLPSEGLSNESYSENEAADALKIPMEDLQWLRKGILKSGRDYNRAETGLVQITQNGMGELAAALEEGRTLLVTGTSIPNPQLILAKLPGGTDVLRVRVADRDAWCRGMVIENAIPTDNPKIWSSTIRPQFKGRA